MAVRAGCCRKILRASLSVSLWVFATQWMSGCSSLPPGADAPKVTSYALPATQTTRLGLQFATAAQAHGGLSGFRIIDQGVDGFVLRMQMINATERTLDLQYFIFRGDATGQLLSYAVLRAADRGVRVRVLLDDGESLAGDEQINALASHHQVEIRVFNPFVYRGHIAAFKAAEFLFNASRLDYRMHNKLMVVDNGLALVGGRNIGDQYFQVDPQSQFADDDLVAVGPTAQALSGSFDGFWNSDLAIDLHALSDAGQSRAALNAQRKTLRDHQQQMKDERVDYLQRVATGEPFNGLLTGALPLVWAPAHLYYDSPNKKKVENGDMLGHLMERPVGRALAVTRSELLMVSPYLIPGPQGMHIFNTLRQRGVRVRILTNSLESSNMVLAHAGYMHYRRALLASGVELLEIRALLGNSRGSGQTAAISSAGNYSLHAKMFVFDRQRLFIGSMNFDLRSMHLNTEVGLIIDSPELAEQLATRFEAMAQPSNAYALELRKHEGKAVPSIVWHTSEAGQSKDYTIEPAHSAWQRLVAYVLSLVAPEGEL